VPSLYGRYVICLISHEFKRYSEKNYDVTCTVLFQGNVQDTNAIYSSFLPIVRPGIVHVARDVICQLMKMLCGGEQIGGSNEARTVN
jgi:hypothetical protein